MGSHCLSEEDVASQGIIPRSVHQIFAAVVDQKPIKVLFQEIYLDTVRDLLNSNNVMKQNNQKSKYEPTVVEVRSIDKVFELLRKAEGNR